MGTCQICENTSKRISKTLGLCLNCIRSHKDEALKISLKVQAQSRIKWNLPGWPPRNPDGIKCNLCMNQCQIPENGFGYCGLRRNDNGRIEGANASKGKLSWYYDPLPTNCVGDWICPGGSGCGYPEYAYRNGPERGYTNLAVFCHACTFNCLYCQNWQFRRQTHENRTVSVDDLTSAVDKKTACVCYFGGDPTPQIPFLLAASREALQNNPDRILRICWETNGSMSDKLASDMAELAFDTGGCIKFDLKAWDETLHISLTGVSNRQTLINFGKLASKKSERPVPPFLIASTLMVPGYIDAIEVERIAAFISSIDPQIPYSLLAFHPQHEMTDLPPTSRKEAMDCLNAAKHAGLERVRIGNEHLLW